MPWPKRLAEAGETGNATENCERQISVIHRSYFAGPILQILPGTCYHDRMEETTIPLPDPLITATPGRLSGAPVFAGTRVPVKTLFDFLEDGAPLSEFLDGFPNVSREHAIAVLELARKTAVAEATKRDAAE